MFDSALKKGNCTMGELIKDRKRKRKKKEGKERKGKRKGTS